MRSTLAHLPPGHCFGVKESESHSIHVSELMGNPVPYVKAIATETRKWKLPAAGLETHRKDDLDLQKHIVPHLTPMEDALLVRKITEDKVGGSYSAVHSMNQFGDTRVYGVPTVRDPIGRIGKVKRFADRTVHLFDLIEELRRRTWCEGLDVSNGQERIW